MLFVVENKECKSIEPTFFIVGYQLCYSMINLLLHFGHIAKNVRLFNQSTQSSLKPFKLALEFILTLVPMTCHVVYEF